jgi:hypothetical protein
VRSGGAERSDSAGLGDGAIGVGWCRVEERGAHALARGEREGTENGRRESKKKTSSAKYAKGTRGRAAERPSGLGGLGQLTGHG